MKGMFIMTRIEKQTIINALQFYSEYQKSQDSVDSLVQYNISSALITTFQDILNKKSGEVKI